MTQAANALSLAAVPAPARPALRVTLRNADGAPLARADFALVDQAVVLAALSADVDLPLMVRGRHDPSGWRGVALVANLLPPLASFDLRIDDQTAHGLRAALTAMLKGYGSRLQPLHGPHDEGETHDTNRIERSGADHERRD